MATGDGEQPRSGVVGQQPYDNSLNILERGLKLSALTLGVFGAITISRRSNRGQMWGIRRHMQSEARAQHRGVNSALMPADKPKHALRLPLASSAALTSLLKGTLGLLACLATAPHYKGVPLRSLHLLHLTDPCPETRVDVEPPLCPIVVVGPEACGASSVVEEALCSVGVTSLLKLNLNEAAASGSLLWGLVRDSGFFLIPESWQNLRLVNASAKETEVERCLRLHAHVFEELASQQQLGGPGGDEVPRPVICVDEMHSRHVVSQQAGEFERFLNWAVHLTDRSLAHVVIVTRPDVVQTLDHAHAPFAQRRHCLWLDYVKPAIVEARLLSTFGVEGAYAEGHPLKPQDAALIAHTIGGQLKDLRNICNAIHRHSDPRESLLQTPHSQGWHRLHGLLISQAFHQLEQRLEDGLACAAEQHYKGELGESLLQAYLRAQRFWALMQQLARQGHVPRTEVIANIYRAFSNELDELLSAGMVTVMPLYLREPPDGSGAQGTGHAETGAAPSADGSGPDNFDVALGDTAQCELCVTAGSPRKLQAMRLLVANERMQSVMARVDDTVRWLSLRKRHTALEQRRMEMAASLRALRCGGEPTQDTACEEQDRLLGEFQVCGRELQQVRAALDGC